MSGGLLSRRKRVARAAAAAVLVVVVLIGFLIVLALREAVAAPIMRKAEVRLDGLGDTRNSYTIALLSDIHIGNRTMTPECLNQIVDAVNAAQPDLVVIVGDFVNGTDDALASDPQALVAPLAGLHATDGVIATLGNHDHWTDPQAVREALEAAGVRVLRNEIAAYGPVRLAGIDDHYSGHADIAATMSTAQSGNRQPLVAISHTPDISPSLPSEIEVVLAGHTHCGQMVVPVIGALAPIFGKVVGDKHYYDPRFQCGVVHKRGRTTIVTAGLGSGSIPMRFNAPPDWWLVTVRGI